TCDNVYCHSDGQTARRSTDVNYTWSNFTPITLSPLYLTTPNWDTKSPAIICDTCHPGPTSGPESGPVTGNMTSPYLIGPPPGDPTSRPDTGTHNSGNHASNNQGMASSGWVTTQCFWCHKANDTPVNATNQQLQGTYGTSLHVDGETHFDPRNYNYAAPSGGTFPDENDYSANYSETVHHCGNPKSCW
ncbi:MAG: CxxxxCH/CxxCH domain-containing protein, partial [Cyclobacteriaceae bacterium]|nr:CxxxxCH/CxxCH domain-containing protein [Cyclobacteriaceae bacterium]